MQKVRYCLSFNRLYIKFQDLLIPSLESGRFTCLFTICSHYYSLSISGLKTLEIDFPLFDRRSSFYDLLKYSHQTHWFMQNRGYRGLERSSTVGAVC